MCRDAEPLEHAVAHPESVLSVDLTEAVHIDQKQGQRLLVAPGTTDLLRQRYVENRARDERRQRVSHDAVNGRRAQAIGERRQDIEGRAPDEVRHDWPGLGRSTELVVQSELVENDALGEIDGAEELRRGKHTSSEVIEVN